MEKAKKIRGSVQEVQYSNKSCKKKENLREEIIYEIIFFISQNWKRLAFRLKEPIFSNK